MGDPVIKGKIGSAQVVTVISWCTYPIVYLFPMMGIQASHAIVGIQIGYCASDIISKCCVGLLIYQISYAKSAVEKKALVVSKSADLENAAEAFSAAQARKNKIESDLAAAR